MMQKKQKSIIVYAGYAGYDATFTSSIKNY